MTTSDYLYGIGWIYTGLNPLHTSPGVGAFAVSPQVWGAVPPHFVGQYLQALVIWQKQMLSKMPGIERQPSDSARLAAAAWWWWKPNEPLPQTLPGISDASDWLRRRHEDLVKLTGVLGLAGGAIYLMRKG
jgi:hypothetical protein